MWKRLKPLKLWTKNGQSPWRYSVSLRNRPNLYSAWLKIPAKIFCLTILIDKSFSLILIITKLSSPSLRGTNTLQNHFNRVAFPIDEPIANAVRYGDIISILQRLLTFLHIASYLQSCYAFCKTYEEITESEVLSRRVGRHDGFKMSKERWCEGDI